MKKIEFNVSDYTDAEVTDLYLFDTANSKLVHKEPSTEYYSFAGVRVTEYYFNKNRNITKVLIRKTGSLK